jgi:hypothetical protein
VAVAVPLAHVLSVFTFFFVPSCITYAIFRFQGTRSSLPLILREPLMPFVVRPDSRLSSVVFPQPVRHITLIYRCRYR